MHVVEIHLQRWKGDRPATEDEQDVVLLTHYLIVNGVEYPRETGARLSYSLLGEAPLGILTLEVHDPGQVMRADFSPEQWIESDDPNLLHLPVRELRFVPYEPPPPPTEFERSLAP